MTSGFIVSGAEQLHYLRWQGGKKLLVCFHGYSNNAGLFADLAAQVAHEYTTIAIDLPYHGKSDWKQDAPWRKQDLVLMLKALLQQEDVEQAALACYSIGGRICLSIAEQAPELITTMLLMAPDGLVPNRFYKFVTHNIAGKRIFHHFLARPERYLGVINWLQERRLINASQKGFVERYTGLPAARAFLAKVWPNLRLMVPDQSRVRRNMARYKIPVHLFMGKYDPVIPLKHAAAFAKDQSMVHIHVLETGHRVIDAHTVKYIAGYLRNT